MKSGHCSIIFFVKCQKALAEEYGDRVAKPEKLQEIVNLLGKAEEIYKGLEKLPQKEMGEK